MENEVTEAINSMTRALKAPKGFTDALRQHAKGGQMSEDGEFMTAKDLADMLGRHRSTIWRWAKNGELPPALTIGDRKYFRRSTVKKWLNELDAEPSS